MGHSSTQAVALFAQTPLGAKTDAALSVWATTPDTSWWPNACWISLAWGSGPPAPLVPASAAASRPSAIVPPPPSALRCTGTLP